MSTHQHRSAMRGLLVVCCAATLAACGSGDSAQPGTGTATSSTVTSSAPASGTSAPTSASTSAAPSPTTSSTVASSAPTSASTSAAPSPATGKATPAAGGRLPERIGTWRLLTDAELSSPALTAIGLPDLLGQLGVTGSTDLAAQMGAQAARLQKSKTPHLTFTMTGQRSFYAEDDVDLQDAGASPRLLMATAQTVGGQDAARVMSLKRADFQAEGKRKGGYVARGPVGLQTRGSGSHGAAVFSGNAWLETEIINDPDRTLDAAETSALVTALSAVGPR
ncbi:MAG: hypothetical protein LWW86_02370 [Micrococcales bacterium]|nr:hypothetical protein [Micrococcales bacterium]